jgi:hypothetical protein
MTPHDGADRGYRIGTRTCELYSSNAETRSVTVKRHVPGTPSVPAAAKRVGPARRTRNGIGAMPFPGSAALTCTSFVPRNGWSAWLNTDSATSTAPTRPGCTRIFTCVGPRNTSVSNPALADASGVGGGGGAAAVVAAVDGA